MEQIIFKKARNTHELYFHEILIILCSTILFPIFPFSLRKFMCVSVHVHLCVLSSACVFNYVWYVHICMLFECVRVCVFCKEIKAWIELIFCADNLTPLYIRDRKLWSLRST